MTSCTSPSAEHKGDEIGGPRPGAKSQITVMSTRVPRQAARTPEFHCGEITRPTAISPKPSFGDPPPPRAGPVAQTASHQAGQALESRPRPPPQLMLPVPLIGRMQGRRST